MQNPLQKQQLLYPQVIKPHRHVSQWSLLLVFLIKLTPMTNFRNIDEASCSFGAYIAAELNPDPSYPTADAIWGETERDRV